MKLPAIRPYLKLRFMILSVAVLNLVLMVLRVRAAEQEMRALEVLHPEGFHISHGYQSGELTQPVLLLAASGGIAINRWWSVLLSLLLSGRVVYALGYLSWKAVHYAHDVPMFSWQAVEKLWHLVYQPRPQYLFQVVLASVIFLFALSWLGRFMYSKTT